MFLEIVAKAKIAEHFKEGMVPRGIADIVEIIVLAAGTHAFLAGGRAAVIARLDPGKEVLELHHARVGEHQGRVVARHERRTLDNLVIIALVEIEEGRADFVQRRHGALFRGSNTQGVKVI
ncbi:hypothetical protein ISM_14960 [Roseovarius nubinhibens ISM]|uniref:Uncharacterized protein n=1 Tax=Roseovarius nubinhibens (strain ATCC BAA-591 / DSM 15170 / ISM) TaxID=89187 RepID=A3SNY6_ROSNI|nr:hypothetical protein ISM_14960 [Roseovarius nubinhibens ISM]